MRRSTLQGMEWKGLAYSLCIDPCFFPLHDGNLGKGVTSQCYVDQVLDITPYASPLYRHHQTITFMQVQ